MAGPPIGWLSVCACNVAMSEQVKEHPCPLGSHPALPFRTSASMEREALSHLLWHLVGHMPIFHTCVFVYCPFRSGSGSGGREPGLWGRAECSFILITTSHTLGMLESSFFCKAHPPLWRSRENKLFMLLLFLCKAGLRVFPWPLLTPSLNSYHTSDSCMNQCSRICNVRGGGPDSKRCIT